jgi:hypothetical protein
VRLLLFCVASDTEWARAGIPGEIVTATMVKGLISRDAAGELALTDHGRAVLRAMLPDLMTKLPGNPLVACGRWVPGKEWAPKPAPGASRQRYRRARIAPMLAVIAAIAGREPLKWGAVIATVSRMRPYRRRAEHNC